MHLRCTSNHVSVHSFFLEFAPLAQVGILSELLVPDGFHPVSDLFGCVPARNMDLFKIVIQSNVLPIWSEYTWILNYQKSIALIHMLIIINQNKDIYNYW